ncbi:hypothetical protein ACWEFJ_15915 [Actinosynnema sp. NPDC004786]
MAALRKLARALLTTAAVTVAITPPASAYPAPGRVTGDIGVHDPSVVKRPDGSYLVAHTGNGISPKTSTDRTAFPNGAYVH